MNTAKAIKILSEDLIPNYPYAIGPKARAIALGIEALKRCREARVKGTIWDYSLLPGETRF